MKTPLRIQFMTWLTAQTLIVFSILAIILFAFNLYEQREHPAAAKEEAAELWIMLGMMAVSLPLMLWAAWLISKRQLKPLRDVLQSAQIIREGKLDHRIETPVENDEIGQVARTINDAFSRYQQALQRLDRFSLDAAHQLRNPLAAIRTSAEICLQQPRPVEEYQNTLGKILEDAAQLNRTVDQLLMLARLNRSDLLSTFENVDLATLVSEIIEQFKPVFDEKRINLTTAIPNNPARMNGIPRLLDQAIANLLDNAARFTPEGGEIGVTLEKQSDGSLMLAIEDSGPGIPEPMRSTVVEQYGQTASRIKQGTGLGLAIAVDIARVHNGSIKASTSRWGGARFMIALPIAPRDSAQISGRRHS